MNNQPMHGAPPYDREREMEEQRRLNLQQQDDIALREREQGERQTRDAFVPAAPHHSNAGSIPIHQPVASRVPGAIHSPGGLLANHGGSAPNLPLGGPTSAAAVFGGPLQADASRVAPPAAQNSTAGPQHQMFGPVPHPNAQPNSTLPAPNGPSAPFGAPVLQQQQQLQDPARGGPPPSYPQAQPGTATAPTGPGMAQGQQPILNDALSYLDQVKVQFQEQPDVYNRFLDIMKDFKSQTIDTPGVISRVSELFAGHPNLIQGFNTFLPPGYRIECGLENNPNSIRVTTPSGSTIHSIGGVRNTIETGRAPGGPNAAFPDTRQPGWQQSSQQSIESPEATFSMPVTNGGGPYQASGQVGSFDGPTSIAQQRGPAAALTGSMTGHVPPPRDAHTPTPGGGPPGLNGNASQTNIEKRGPVEFNHAISYVNKIKNRFQDKPEIYKQFLEILQTYQREQKPIQDVYSQVTTLFHTAPDLLEDFKQFLPESAASARSFGPRGSEDVAALRAGTSTPQPGHSGTKMPPIGSFAPPTSASKESKKRQRNEKHAPLPPAGTNDAQASAARALTGASASNKRAKVAHRPSAAADAISVEPTLTPYMPEPLVPAPLSPVTQEQLSFFERARKHLANRLSMSEFLRLLNLYSQDLIDEDVLLHKASQFFGANPDLLKFFTETVRSRGKDEHVENQPEPPDGRVSLSNCRGYGPSYRLLPRRERLKPCSGRDELCNEVLNDEWASHPTWASEDSGFVAHRKNGYEEGLHRIEEERHDYDFYIELNQKCIQLLEPIAQQMLSLPPSERATFKLPAGLGGQSTSIYKRVLKKIYGSDRGAEVVHEMFTSPFAVVPIVMARLRQKDEEWRFTQREWEKVWQAQTDSMHLKSLDHMGIQVKSNDKKNLSIKHLVDNIHVRHEAQERARISKGKEAHEPRYQYIYHFEDEEVLLDILRFMVIFATNGGQHNAVERRRIIDFFESFIPHFFDLPEGKVTEKLADIEQDSGAEEEEDEHSATDLANGRPKRNGKKSDLLRGVLDPGRNGTKARAQKEDSAAASTSKETTPDIGSANEEEMPDAPDENGAPTVSNERWMPTIPQPTIRQGDRSLLDDHGELRADAPFRRTTYNFYCNQNIFIFVSILEALYKRVKDLKGSTASVGEELRRERADKPAKTLGLVADESSYFDNVAPEQYWTRTLALIEEYINGELDENRYQDILRRYYLQNGWQLYTIQDLLRSLCRVGLICNNPDSKGEKTKELVKEYFLSRQHDETSYQTEISARRFAEKCIKDGEMYVIGWMPEKRQATIRYLPKDETTFYMDEMEERERWQYYVSSWTRLEPTEGVDRSRVKHSVLVRNIPQDTEEQPRPRLAYSEGMVVAICLNSSKVFFESGTSEYFIYKTPPASEETQKRRETVQKIEREVRDQKFEERADTKNLLMKDLTAEQVMEGNKELEKLLGNSEASAPEPAAPQAVAAAA